MISIGDTYTFNTTATAWKARNGQQAKVLWPLTAEEVDLENAGPMYRVVFPDEVEIDVFEDELS